MNFEVGCEVDIYLYLVLLYYVKWVFVIGVELVGMEVVWVFSECGYEVVIVEVSNYIGGVVFVGG